MDLTLAILKPDCIKKKLIGKVIDFIESKGFRIICMKMVHLNRREAKEFYAIHREHSFFNDLISFMTSGPCIPMVLEKKNAVSEFRRVIGATNPKEAEKGTLRELFADNVQENIIHGSDSTENSKKEIAFFFTQTQIIDNIENK